MSASSPRQTSRNRTNSSSTLFTVVLAGFTALALNMVILTIDTSGLAGRLGIPSGVSSFLWTMIASSAIISALVLAVRRGLVTESELLRKEAEAELSRSQHRFVSRVSHALRTPLTGINGFAHLMQEAAESPEEGFAPEAFVDPVIAETADLRRMIDDLLMSAQLDTGTSIASLDDVSALGTIEDAVASVSALGMNTNIESGDARLIADRAHLSHVLRNLLVNAHRHGGGPVTLRSRVHGNRLLTEVVDEGGGVPPEAEPWLFSTAPPDRWSPSMGLGLDVAQRLCERMGAEISYRRVKRQTLFRVSVPLARSDSRHDQYSEPGGSIRRTLQQMGKIRGGGADRSAAVR